MSSNEILNRTRLDESIDEHIAERVATDPMARWLHAIEATVTTYIVPGIDTSQIDPVVMPGLIAQALDLLASDEQAMEGLTTNYS